MKTLFQTTIEHLLKSHNQLEAFQTQDHFHLRLDMAHFDRLVIERHGELISVSHSFEQNGDLISDPDVELHYPSWIPTAITQCIGYRREKFIEGERKVRQLVSITEASQESHTSQLGPCNVSFQYLYRDASNYKLRGEAIFTNHTSMPIEEVEKQIRSFLKDGEFFIARQVHIEERFFDVLYDDDHPWHEFSLVEATSQPVFDPENCKRHKHKRDVSEFIADLEKAHRAGWDEMDVRPDVAKLLERQKRELKQAFENEINSIS